MAVAYPFVEVALDDKGLVPIAVREPGVVAIVGMSDAGAVAAGVPMPVDDVKAAGDAFGPATPLGRSLSVALKQVPAPAKVYGLKVASDDDAGWTAAFEILSGVQDITFVAAAERPIRALGGGALDVVDKLKTHCEDNAANGQPRIGVACTDSAVARSATYAADAIALVNRTRATTAG